MRSSAAVVALSVSGCHIVLGLEGIEYDSSTTTTFSGGGDDGATSGGGVGGDTGGGGVGGCTALAVPQGDAKGSDCSTKLGLDDDFADAAATEKRWMLSNDDGTSTVEQCSADGTLRLTMGGPDQYWFETVGAAFVHQNVCGDFAVLARLRVATTDEVAPSLTYNAMGILLRDASALPEARWALLSHGSHDGPRPLGTALYWTVPNDTTHQTEVEPGSVMGGTLMACRVNGQESFYRKLDGETTPVVVRYPENYGFGCCLQVGITGHRFSLTEGLRGSYDEVTFHPVNSTNDCVELLANTP